MNVASFWTINPQGTWPPVSVAFLILIAVVLLKAYGDYRERNGLSKMHYHKDSKGILHECYHACKQHNLFFSKMYWISLTLAFLLEHIVYHKLWPFYLLSKWLNVG